MLEIISERAAAGTSAGHRMVRAALTSKLAKQDLGGLNVAQYLSRLLTRVCLAASGPEHARIIQQFWQHLTGGAA